jgi:hypothetical protein
MNPQLSGFRIKSQEESNYYAESVLEGYILYAPCRVVLSIAKWDPSRSPEITLDKSAVSELIRLLKEALDTDEVVSAWKPKASV